MILITQWNYPLLDMSIPIAQVLLLVVSTMLIKMSKSTTLAALEVIDRFQLSN